MTDFVPVFFKDFGKTVSDVLKPSKYNLGKQVVVKSISKQNVEFNISSNLLEDGASGKLNLKTTACCGRIFESELHASGKTINKVTCKKLVDGLQLVLSNESKVSDLKSSVHGIDASYSRKNLAVTSTVMTNLFKNYTYDGSVSVGASGVSVGVQGKVKDGEIADYAAGAQYADSDFVLTVKSLNKADKVFASYSHQISPSSTVVSAFEYDLSKANAGVSNMTVGGTYKIDEQSKASAMYTTEGALSAIYETKVREGVSLTLGTVFNINDLTRQNVGIKLSLGA